MLAEERFAAIQELLHKKRAATVTELAQALDASESTIRRDLILLAGQGKLNKVHGGAVAREEAFDSGEAAMSAKEQLNVAEKQAIARYAAKQIQPDDVVFLDAGSTTLMMLDFLQPGGAVLPLVFTQQVAIPAFLPPWMSLVRESPTMTVRSLEKPGISRNTASKNATLGLGAPMSSEMNTPSK